MRLSTRASSARSAAARAASRSNCRAGGRLEDMQYSVKAKGERGKWTNDRVRRASFAAAVGTPPASTRKPVNENPAFNRQGKSLYPSCILSLTGHHARVGGNNRADAPLPHHPDRARGGGL